MVKGRIKCPNTGILVVVDANIIASVLEAAGKTEQQPHTLKNCAACSGDHKWTSAELIDVGDH
jgi:hypothetical protein